MFTILRQKLEARRERKKREYWATMTDAKAKGVAHALACEVGQVAAGDFMDKYEQKKAAGLTATSN